MSNGDVLQSRPVEAVEAWYRRLANRIGEQRINREEPLAASFLRHYMDNRDPQSSYQIPPPAHLQNNSLVADALLYHRRVFLTQEKARFTGGRTIWAGIIPRLQGLPGFTRWEPQGQANPLPMHYQSLVEFPLRWQVFGTPEERDLLTSLRGFQLRSNVIVHGSNIPNSNRVSITFVEWQCSALDRYDFNYSEYFTVPNPDYRSTRRDAIEPHARTIRVYHRNAQRLEQAHLASPYNIEITWRLTDARMTGPGEVDRSRDLRN